MEPSSTLTEGSKFTSGVSPPRGGTHPSWGAAGSTSSSAATEELWESSSSADFSSTHVKEAQEQGWVVKDNVQEGLRNHFFGTSSRVIRS